MIDEHPIRYRWEAVGSKLDELGRQLFATGELRTTTRHRCPKRRFRRLVAVARRLPRPIEGSSRPFSASSSLRLHQFLALRVGADRMLIGCPIAVSVSPPACPCPSTR